MNVKYQASKSVMSAPNLKSKSALTPLLSKEGSSFEFSPRVISRCLNQSGTTPKHTSKINRRSSPQFLCAQEVSFGQISPIEVNSENDEVFYKVPANSPVSPAAADFGSKSMPNVKSRDRNNQSPGASVLENSIPHIRIQRSNISLPLERRLCLETILRDICMEHLEDVFAKEEIDLEVFLIMTASELQSIGICDADLPALLEAIEEYS